MSYLDGRITREEFIKTRGAERTQQNAKFSLNLFDKFCQGTYQKNGDELILEIQTAIEEDHAHDRLFRLCNSFVLWLLDDHPDIEIQKYHHKTSLKKHHPTTIRGVIIVLRQYLEEFGQIEFSERLP